MWKYRVIPKCIRHKRKYLERKREGKFFEYETTLEAVLDDFWTVKFVFSCKYKRKLSIHTIKNVDFRMKMLYICPRHTGCVSDLCELS